MFYSTQILTRKGALGTIWVASHLEKRLKRNQVFETSIPASVDSIINPEAPLALRLSGQLLLGVVRVYLRKLTYLQEDAQHAVEGLAKGTGQGGGAAVDLPDGGTAPEVAITLPDADPMALFATATGADLFPTFDANLLAGDGGEGGRGLFQGPSDSLTVAQDISELFGSKWSGPVEDERFEVPDQIDRRFSVELERLRSAAAAEAPKPGEGLFFEPPPEDAYAPAPADELMEAPPDDLFAVQSVPEAGRTPLSGSAPLPGLSDMRVTPASLAGPESLLPDMGAGPATTSHLAARSVDVDAEGRPATELPSNEIRALLRDRKPLLVPRGLRARREPPALPPQRYDVDSHANAAADSFLRPSALATLAPELLALFQRIAPEVTAATPGSAHRRLGAAVPEVAGPAAADGPEPHEAEEREEEQPGLSGFTAGEGADFSSLGPQLGPEDEWIEDSQQRQELFPGGGEGEALGGENAAAAGPSSGGRSSLALELSSGAGALPSTGWESGEDSELAGAARDAFTRRTRMVLGHLQGLFVPAPGSKRRHSAAGNLTVPELSLNAVVASKSRLDAARWFFEALVLRGRGYVDLAQAEPYGDIAVLPRQKLLDAAPGAAAR